MDTFYRDKAFELFLALADAYTELFTPLFEEQP